MKKLLTKGTYYDIIKSTNNEGEIKMTMQEKLKNYYTENLIKQLFCFAINCDADFIYEESLTPDDWLMENFGTSRAELKEFLNVEYFDEIFPKNS